MDIKDGEDSLIEKGAKGMKNSTRQRSLRTKNGRGRTAWLLFLLIALGLVIGGCVAPTPKSSGQDSFQISESDDA